MPSWAHLSSDEDRGTSKEKDVAKEPPPTICLFFYPSTLFLPPLSKPSQRWRISEAQRGKGTYPGSHSKSGQS